MTRAARSVASILKTYKECLAFVSLWAADETAVSLFCPRPLKNVSDKSPMSPEQHRG
jgi:hypothetical protein